MYFEELFQYLKVKSAKITEGRYGFDELSMSMNIAGLVMILFAYIPYMQWLSIAAWVLIIWAFFRTMSKNQMKRRGELNKYYEIRKKITDKFTLRNIMRKERKRTSFSNAKLRCHAACPQGKRRHRCDMSKMQK